MLSNKYFINSVTDTFLAPPFLAPPFLSPPFFATSIFATSIYYHKHLLWRPTSNSADLIFSRMNNVIWLDFFTNVSGVFYSFLWSSSYLSNTFISASLSSYLNCIKSSLTFLYLWCYLMRSGCVARTSAFGVWRSHLLGAQR